MSLLEQLASWAAGLSFDDIPLSVVTQAKSQILSQLAAVRAGTTNPAGKAIITSFGSPLQPNPKSSAYVLAALSMCLDFDDTAFAGHLSHSCVNVPLAYTHYLQLDGKTLLTAVITANECAARITAAATLGYHRGQTASHTHLVGSVAGRLSAQRAAASYWVNAWGIALSMPNWVLMPGFLGSDAKLFTAATPVRAGLDAVDAALAGLHGLSNIVEIEDGFLQQFADVPLPEMLTKGLGTRWHTQTISFKIYPGCAYLDSAIDCAVAVHAELAERFSPVELAESVTSIKIHASIFTVGMDEESRSFVKGPSSPLSALNFSTGYSVATALAYGTLSPVDFLPEQIDDPVRWILAGKVQLILDLDLTEKSLLATAPLGEALREGGTSAAEWLTSKGGEIGSKLAAKLERPSSDFTRATKSIGARLEVELDDGTLLEKSCEAAKGSVGTNSPAQQWALMVEKFLITGGHEDTTRAIENLEYLSPSQTAAEVEKALQIVEQ